MDQYIKQSIDARRNALFSSFEVSGEIKKEADEVFAEMEKLGSKCKDVGEFEAEFSKSPLNQQYMDLFTKIATGGTTKATVGKTIAANIAGGILSGAVDQVKRSVVPTRASVNQKVTDAARSVPVLGDVMDINQKTSYAKHLGGLFRKKK